MSNFKDVKQNCATKLLISYKCVTSVFEPTKILHKLFPSQLLVSQYISTLGKQNYLPIFSSIRASLPERSGSGYFLIDEIALKQNMKSFELAQLQCPFIFKPTAVYFLRLPFS